MDGDPAGGSEGRRRKGKRKGRGTKSSKKGKEVTTPPRLSDGEEEETESLVPINITDLTLEDEERILSSPSTDTPKSPTAEEVEEFEQEQKKKAEEKKKKTKKKNRKSGDDESTGSY